MGQPTIVAERTGKFESACGDYKTTVNPVIDYPLPCSTDLFATLAGGQLFSKIDLAQQMLVEPDSRGLLTILILIVVYNRLPFGIASAPAIFQRLWTPLYMYKVYLV